MNLKQLEYFVRVAELGSFSKAARVMEFFIFFRHGLSIRKYFEGIVFIKLLNFQVY